MKTKQDVFDASRVAKKLLREARSGALATAMSGTGAPYCSLVNVATDAAGAPLFLLSRLAVHTRNILADPRLSLMLQEESAADPLESARISLLGRVSTAEDIDARRRYLARHPQARAFADFADFSFYRMAVESTHIVAGFGRIADLAASDLLTEITDAQALVSIEPEILAHMNEDHADALRLYATKLLGARDGLWTCVGCDPEGLELQLGHAALRLAFPHRIKTAGALREMLRNLADQARAQG